jgi:arylsulfatase A-like enzyme
MKATDRRPNILILMTDQQRAVQHWPAGWVKKNLPSVARLAKRGLTFNNAFTSAAECSPSRAALLTSTYPQQNGVTTTPGTLSPTGFRNMAQVMTEAGYVVAWKGKWHLTQGSDDTDSPDFLAAYDANQWNPPDAGTTLQADSTLGGGTPNNDGRYVSGMDGKPGQTQGYGQSVVEFLSGYDKSGPPFCLFVSLVNPHDVHVLLKDYEAYGYKTSDFKDTGISLPENYDDSLLTKPSVQLQFMRMYHSFSRQESLNYVNFYAYLHKVVDAHITKVLDTLDGLGLTDDTLIVRFSDHGEMGLSHRLCEKMYTAYDETIRVPLVFSNPKLFPKPVETDSFATLIDLLPTLAEIAGARGVGQMGFRGKSLGPVLRDPRAAVQDGVLFTYDDPLFFSPSSPLFIRALRKRDWMYAVYFNDAGTEFQYELYNLADDPGELNNLTYDVPVFPEWRRLHRELTKKVTSLGAAPAGFDWSKADPRPWSNQPLLPTHIYSMSPEQRKPVVGG